MLAMMVFVASPLNDLGDIKGYNKAGRTTNVIVLGKENTIRLSILITLRIVFSSWILYAISKSSFESNRIELQNVINAYTIVLPLTVTGTCVLLIFHLLNLLKRTEDQDHIRESVGKKSMPMHLLLQLSLVIGCSACSNETDESIK